MWRFLDDGLRVPNIRLSDIVWLFRRPEPLPDRSERKCWHRECGRRAFRDGSYCEPHEIEQRLDMYDPEDGWDT